MQNERQRCENTESDRKWSERERRKGWQQQECERRQGQECDSSLSLFSNSLFLSLVSLTLFLSTLLACSHIPWGIEENLSLVLAGFCYLVLRTKAGLDRKIPPVPQGSHTHTHTHIYTHTHIRNKITHKMMFIITVLFY